MARLAKFWPILSSASLLLLAFPPFHLGLLVFVALIPWLSSLQDLAGKQSFKSGYVFGVIFLLGQFFWLFQFINKWTNSAMLSLIPYVLAVLVVALFFGCLGVLVSICRRRNWLVLVPFVWAGIEVVRSYFPGLAFPWALLPTPLESLPGLLQLGYFGTIFLTSAWIVLANIVGLLVLERAPAKQIRVYVIAFIALGLLSYVRYGSPIEGTGTRVLIAQPGVDMAFDPDSVAKTRASIREISLIADRTTADLLILPEGVADIRGGMPPTLDVQLPKSTPVIFGASRRTSKGTFQSAFSYDGTWNFADKNRLVVFGEYVPLRDKLTFLDGFKLPSGDLIASDATTALPMKKFVAGPMLCFEALFPDVAWRQAKNGSQIVTVLSIDDWFMGTSAPEQLASASIFRAIETGLPVARAASTGISMAVDQRGNVLKKTNSGNQTILDVELVLPKEPEVFPLQILFPYLFAFSLIGVPLADWWLKRSVTTAPEAKPKDTANASERSSTK